MKQESSGVQIRRAKVDDARSIAAVLSESFAEYKGSYTPEAFAATTPTPFQVQNRVEGGPVWVALSYGRIIGTVSAVPEGKTLHIRSMAIVPSARGQHIGESMLEQVERFASEHGYQRLTLSTTPFLTRAIRLYEHVGFKRSRKGRRKLFGTPLFAMEKNLKLG
jgi:putative acetyltransferase